MLLFGAFAFIDYPTKQRTTWTVRKRQVIFRFLEVFRKEENITHLRDVILTLTPNGECQVTTNSCGTPKRHIAFVLCPHVYLRLRIDANLRCTPSYTKLP
jgi:hypothetical protein